MLVAIVIVLLTACVPIVLCTTAMPVMWPVAMVRRVEVLPAEQPLALRALVSFRAPPSFA